MAVVMEVTPNGHVAWFRAGTGDAVLFTPCEVSKLVKDLRDLQATAMEGMTWSDV